MQNVLQLSQQLRETLKNDVTASRVVLVEIIGRLPLPDHVIIGCVVCARVVVVLSALHQQITKSNAPAEAPEVLHLDVAPPEEIKQLVRLGIVDLDDILPQDSGVIGAV